MSQWANYRAELGPQKFKEYQWGFFSYVLYDEILCIEDAYVVPSQRRKGYFKIIIAEAQRIAKEAGKKQVIGCVTLTNAGAAAALKCHLAIGGDPYLAEGNKVWLRMGVG